METLSRVLRTLTFISIIVLLGLLNFRLHELTLAVVDQRNAVEVTVKAFNDITSERCQLDARMRDLEANIESMRQGTIMFKLDLSNMEMKDAE